MSKRVSFACLLLILMPLLISSSGALALPTAPAATTSVYLPSIRRPNCNLPLGATYCITNLDIGNIVVPSGINNAGQVAATAYESIRSLPHAVLWSTGLITQLGSLGGGTSVAYAINNAGQVVGSSSTGAFEFHAFLWQDGAMTDLGTLGGPDSFAYGINDAGQVVGAAATSEKGPNGAFILHAFLWQNGVMTDLGTLGGIESRAMDINSSGQVVGFSLTGATTPDGVLITHAFSWQNGAMTDLGTLGGPSTGAQAIDDAGTIVGDSMTADRRFHAARWQQGAITDLGAPAGGESHAKAINAAGQVVGDSGYPTLWQDGQAVNLNTRIDPGSGWALWSATAINDSGQILGSGSFDDRPATFVLTPVQ